MEDVFCTFFCWPGTLDWIASIVIGHAVDRCFLDPSAAALFMRFLLSNTYRVSQKKKLCHCFNVFWLFLFLRPSVSQNIPEFQLLSSPLWKICYFSPSDPFFLNTFSERFPNIKHLKWYDVQFMPRKKLLFWTDKSSETTLYTATASIPLKCTVECSPAPE
jgi:hypothetical protein